MAAADLHFRPDFSMSFSDRFMPGRLTEHFFHDATAHVV